MTSSDIIFKIAALKKAYRGLRAGRLGKIQIYLPIEDSTVREVAEKLENVSLAVLFVESQFHCMPLDWCIRQFHREYPPVEVVFSGKCWDRYEEYCERGIRDAR